MSTPTREGEIEAQVGVEHEETPYVSGFYAWYCVFILMGIYINSFLDRQILSLLVGPIKEDFALSDSQMGFLMGPSFAIFYIVAGLPLGWAADRMSRRWLIGLGQMFWSIASVSFGLGRTYGQLLAARIGVGVGEASLSPSAYSMITDMFPPQRLAFALSVYGMGIFIGGGLALLAGGYVLDFAGEGAVYSLPLVGERKSWQIVFFTIALPTIPLTLLLLSLREPIRRGVGKLRMPDGRLETPKVPLVTLVRYVRANFGTVLCHNVGFAWLAFSGYGAAAWIPAFYIRLHEWDAAFVGKVLGWTTIIAGPLGILFGGWLGDKLTARGFRDAKMRVGVIVCLAWLPFGVLFPLMPNPWLALVVSVPATFIGAMSWGVAPAAIQEMMPNQLRGQASAIYIFVVNLLGLALGPQIVALMTDYVFRDEMQVHYSLIATGALAHILGGALLIAGLSRYRRSLDYLERWQRGDVS